MSGILGNRTRARVQALQIVFQAEMQNVDIFDLIDSDEYALEDGPLDEYAEHIARGVAKNRLSIDRLMGGVSENWSFSRMPRVDRAIMSVAIYEMFYEDNVDISVSINEAVEISKLFGTEDSPQFINGILGKIARMIESAPQSSLEELARSVACKNESSCEQNQDGSETDVQEAGSDITDELQ